MGYDCCEDVFRRIYISALMFLAFYQGGNMRAPFTQLYVHYVWATWDRLPLITDQIEQQIYASILAKSRSLKCEPLAIGGIPDHLHLLVRQQYAVSVADLVKGVKGSSSHLVTHELRQGKFFKWQGGYGAFTVSKVSLDPVIHYINLQKKHHADDDLWSGFELTMVDGS